MVVVKCICECRPTACVLEVLESAGFQVAFSNVCIGACPERMLQAAMATATAAAESAGEHTCRIIFIHMNERPSAMHGIAMQVTNNCLIDHYVCLDCRALAE